MRISRVVEAGAENAERMVLKTEESEEVLWISKERVVTKEDVKLAYPKPKQKGVIVIRLTEEGAEKVFAETSKMRIMKDRLAVIVDGKLVSAPVIMAALGSRFEIGGLDDYGRKKLDALAREMSGLPPRAPGEPMLKPPESSQKLVHYTEEEYQERKAQREELGLFFLEKAVSQRQLDRKLEKGMTEEEVVAIFGRPTLRSEDGGDGNSSLTYMVAPERLTLNPKRKMRPTGFSVDFEDAKVSFWGVSMSTESRAMKVVGGPEYTLELEMPKVDFSVGNVDWIQIFEGIEIADPTQEINLADMGVLLTVASYLTGPAAEEFLEKKIQADCDMMKILAHHFPEVAALRKGAKHGVIRVREFKAVMEDYTWGGKMPPGFGGENEEE